MLKLRLILFVLAMVNTKSVNARQSDMVTKTRKQITYHAFKFIDISNPATLQSSWWKKALHPLSAIDVMMRTVLLTTIN